MLTHYSEIEWRLTRETNAKCQRSGHEYDQNQNWTRRQG